MVKHLIIASCDGISTHFCGVGSIVRNTILTLNEIFAAEKIKISLACISASKKGKVFNSTYYQDSIELVQKSGGYFIPLCNGTQGLDEWDMWQSFPQWDMVCAALATTLATILNPDDDNILMLHDTPFLPFTIFQAQIFDKPLRCYYLLHSSGLNHTFGDLEWRNKRIQLEKDAFLLISADNNSAVLANGESFGQHLIKDYNLSFSENDYLKNGLYFNQYENDRQKIFSNKQLEQFNINIPDNSKIIFSWGRCSTVKGFKELTEAWQNIAEELPDHYLIIQAPNNSGEDDYYHNLKKLSGIVPRTIFIDDFNPQIWKTVLRCVNTDIVCIPSLMDPNPLTPIEAKLFCQGMNYSIVASDRDGIKDSFTNDQCFRIDPLEKNNFSSAILQAARINPEKKQEMINSNIQSLNNYDYSLNFKKFLKEKFL
jgi:glycosyltransferase involved in cell wall biosynthesis